MPLGDVVADAVAGDDIERVLLRQIARAAPDHDRDLALVVELGRGLRDHGVVVCPAQRGRRLLEDDRLFRDLRAGLGGVIRIVEPDRDEVAHAADAGAEPRAGLHGGELGNVGLADFGEALRRERFTGDVRHDFRQVADAALVVDDAGLFAAGRAEADELHVSPSKDC